MARRVAEAKRRVAEAQSKLAVKDNPYMVRLSNIEFVSWAHCTICDSPSRRREGRIDRSSLLNKELDSRWRPILSCWTTPRPLRSLRKTDTSPCSPNLHLLRYAISQNVVYGRLSLPKANVRNVPTPPPAPVPVVPVESKANPYASGAAAAPDSGFEGAPRERVGRNFRFNPKGKYVQIANQVRQEAQLEQLKQRIAESARKAGLDTEFETLEKNIRVGVPAVSTADED